MKNTGRRHDNRPRRLRGADFPLKTMTCTNDVPRTAETAKDITKTLMSAKRRPTGHWEQTSPKMNNTHANTGRRTHDRKLRPQEADAGTRNVPMIFLTA